MEAEASVAKHIYKTLPIPIVQKQQHNNLRFHHRSSLANSKDSSA